MAWPQHKVGPVGTRRCGDVAVMRQSQARQWLARGRPRHCEHLSPAWPVPAMIGPGGTPIRRGPLRWPG